MRLLLLLLVLVLLVGVLLSDGIACKLGGDFFIEEAFINGVAPTLPYERDRLALAFGSSQLTLRPYLEGQSEPALVFRPQGTNEITLEEF